MRTIDELSDLIIDWAAARDLLKEENAPKQYLKVLEEVGETARAILKGNKYDAIDGFGDIAVTIVILARQLDTELDSESKWSNAHMGDDFQELLECVSPLFVEPFALEILRDVAKTHQYDLQECMESAFGEIANREGSTIDGIFVKK